MKLLPNEEIVEFSFRGLTLTTHRIRLQGDDECTSIFLRDIASIELKYQVQTFWLLFILAGILGLIAGYNNNEMAAMLLGVVGCIFGVAMYHFTRKRKFVITSSGSSKISFSISNTSFATAMNLLEIIESKKYKSVVQKRGEEANSPK